MRQMLDMYLTSDPSRVLSNFGDASLLQHGVEDASNNLPDDIKNDPAAMNETIENNMRKAIIEQMPTNPAYFEKMSVLLLELVRLRKEGAIKYEELLKQYEDLASQLQPEAKKSYPEGIDSKPRQALYDNLDQNVELAITIDSEIREKKDNDWRGTTIKKRKVEIIIRNALNDFNINDEAKVAEIFELVVNQSEY